MWQLSQHKNAQMGGKQFDLRGDGPNYTLKTLNYLDLQTLFGASFRVVFVGTLGVEECV